MIGQKRYRVDFLIRVYQPTATEIVKNALVEFCDQIEITQQQETFDTERVFSIRLVTEDPTLIFDTCSAFGRIKSVKVDEAA